MEESKYYLSEGFEYIELIKLLKILRISESGGQAKMMVDDQLVTVNGALESRYRAKLRDGFVVEIFDQRITIEAKKAE